MRVGGSHLRWRNEGASGSGRPGRGTVHRLSGIGAAKTADAGIGYLLAGAQFCFTQADADNRQARALVDQFDAIGACGERHPPDG